MDRIIQPNFPVIADHALRAYPARDFRFAGNSLRDLSVSPDLATRQAVADQYMAPQADYGSLLDTLEVKVK